MALLSFSIDLSRSTETKSAINKICFNNAERKDYLIRQYFRVLTNIERHLYFQCIYEEIPLENLFLVKCIGDELWYVYEWDEEKYKKEQFVALILKFLFILNNIASRQDNFFISARDVPWNDEKSNPDIWNKIPHERINLPRKVYADILYDYYNYTTDRAEIITENLKADLYHQNKYIKRELDIDENIKEKFKAILPVLVERLNIGVFSEKTGRDEFRIKNIRFDPIGADVDLFFRCASRAIPALLRVGENLFNLIASQIEENQFVVQSGSPISSPYEYLSFIRDNYRNGSLKGVFKNYSIYTIPLTI